MERNINLFERKEKQVILQLENVSYRRNGKKILSDINWTVNKGEHWIILGLNGSGKTTLLNLLNGYIFPSSGKAKVLDFSFGESMIIQLRQEIGWISSSLQQELPYQDTVLEIVLSGKFASIGLWEEVSEEDIQKARNILRQLGVDALENQQYQVLSQGEKQRVLISRALMNDPKILIFDEASNGLDIFGKKEIYSLMEQLSCRCNIIFVTHNTEEMLPFFQKVLLLKNGSIHSQGNREDMITLENLQSFFDQDIEVFEHNEKFYLTLK